MTADLQQTRYDQIIRRVGGIIGPGAKVNEVLPELFPTFEVETQVGELMRLGGTRLGFGGSQITGAVGESGRIQIFNPVGSGLLATVTSVVFGINATSIIRWGIRNTPLTSAVATETLRDTRELAPDAPVCEIRQESSVALANATGQARAAANEPFIFSDPNGIIVLAPGTGLEAGPTVNNIQFIATFYWRERVALQSEFSL